MHQGYSHNGTPGSSGQLFHSLAGEQPRKNFGKKPKKHHYKPIEQDFDDHDRNRQSYNRASIKSFTRAQLLSGHMGF